MSRAKKALIVGGGVAGPVAAMALRQAGINSVVYEAYAGGADDAGAFLTFASNGLDALRTIDAHHLVLSEGFPTPRMTIQSGTGKHLGDVPNGGTLPDGTVSQTLKRADLYRALRDEAVRRGARVEYGKRLVDAETTPDGVVALFEDGTEAAGDLLIGADGIHSRTRRIIDPSAPRARYVPVLNIGGYARDVAVQAEPGTFRMVFGKRAFFGYAVHPSGEVWWFANPPRAEEPTRAELAAIGTGQWREKLMDLFAGRRDHPFHPRKTRRVGYLRPPLRTDLVQGFTGHHRGRGARYCPFLGTGCVHGYRGCRRARQVPTRPAGHRAGLRRLRAAAQGQGGAHRRARGENEQQQGRRAHRPGAARPDDAPDPQARCQG
jgi:2-polyprenyl-6-methoxyphenol hydroxylase-like FAD-dependent oxidoreductase